MTEKRLCPKCGTELSPGAAHGLCPKCLLDAGLQSQAPPSAGNAVTGPFVTPSQSASPTIPPSSASANPYLEKLARQFPQLDSFDYLGKGGMGVVYKARQRHLNRLVAVKILPPSAGDDGTFAERFTREAQALAQLNHPHIVQVYDFGRTDEFFYFIMEYVDGVNLRALIRDGKLTPEQALKIVPQICDALQFAHDEGIVHRDIKPENILIDKKGRVKVADFGLAKLLGRTPDELSLTGTGQLMGTLGYMAPEQLQEAHSVDHRADIYSLGVVFYEMLTGKLPIGRFDPPSKRVAVDIRIDEVVLRSLESEPGRRYQHASEIKEQVDRITHSGSPAAGTAGPPAHEPAYAYYADQPQSELADWVNRLKHLDPQEGRKLTHIVAGVLGAAAGLFFIALATHMLDKDYALFGGIACSILAGLVGRLGQSLFPADAQTLIADNPKLQAALTMSAGPQRDQTLLKVAHEAAENGESQVAVVALQLIQDLRVRDDAAVLCAQHIAENEGTEAALSIASMIQDNARRDGVLQKLIES
jgi:predicted Ser/Thr protein kinase